jgi:hypothetical protein
MTKLNWEQLIQWDKDDLINYIETLQETISDLQD